MNNPYTNKEIRKGKRVSLGIGINSWLHSIDESDEEGKKAHRAATVQRMFRDCCKNLYGNSAFLVLQNINAVYILNERDKGMLKKPLPDAKKIKRLAIYTSDSTVYADLDSRQEMIKLWFDSQNERIDKLDLYFSKFNMRKRFPFKNDCEFMKNNIVTDSNIGSNVVLPKNVDNLLLLIDKIEDTKLKSTLKKLISSK